VGQQLQAPKGTVDILPADAARWRYVEAVARDVLGAYRYAEIRTPIYEATELFVRSVGEGTDIVGKEMFSFEDRGGRALTLRPECTAGVARAYIEHKLYTRPGPQKLWYLGPMFRAERPQKGRQRQFWQLGVECLGSDDSRFDAEAIVLAADFLARLGLTGLETQLNSVGCADCRPAYRERLQAYLRQHTGTLCCDCKARVEQNPLRVLDCKVPGCAPVIAGAPALDGSLCDACSMALTEVTGLLDAAG
jgi:histidyl-tRNA synthetase